MHKKQNTHINNIEKLYKQAMDFHQHGELEKAKTLYQKILSLNSKHAESMHGLGMLAAQLNQLDTAIEWFEEAIKQQPDIAIFYNNLANAFFKLNNLKQALSYYKRALEIDPEHAETHNNLGNLYYKQKKFDDALHHYAKAVHHKPEYAAAHNNLGLLFLKQGKLKEATTEFKNVVTLNPYATHAHYQLGNLYLKQKNLKLAMQHYQRVIELEPEHTEALNNIGVILLQQKKAQDAIDYFTRVLAFDNDHLDARSNIAVTFLQHDRFENAIRHYKIYLKVLPKDIDANFNIAVAFMALGQLRKAIQHLEVVLQEEPRHIDSYCNLAAIYLRLSERRKAKHLYQKAKKLDPNNSIINYMLDALTGKQHADKAPSEYIKNLFDNYANQFDKHLQEQLRYQAPAVLHQALAKVTNLEKTNWDILDLGCGSGLAGKEFRSLAKNLVGVDLSEKMIDEAKNKNVYDQLEVGEINQFLSEKIEAYDLIIAADVFCYLGDLKETFQKCAAALKEKSFLIFTVEKTKKTDFFLKNTARFSHNKKYIKKLAVEYGFIILYCESTSYRKQENKNVPGYVFVIQKCI